MRTLCTLLIWGKSTYKLHVWADLPPVSSAVDNNIEISLLVGEQEQNWKVCNTIYVGFPHGNGGGPSPYTHVLTKPMMLPEEEASDLVEEIRENFPLLEDG